ncbi:hypothetical protein HMN09_01417600 [Mycena chlorophos]|uniref:F-box domain-containing protein n=1 Tax=Mycena chlorophos TaxID=658473 RepID=A0A8H6VNE0_MYCCL|nr:hypothetical protein HMN09_01417600 [Mycena chlorophos]
MVADLPQELIDAIIYALVAPLDLDSDPWAVESDAPAAPAIFSALRACSLVAHAFARPCQEYLFHGIVLDDDGANTRLTDVLNTSPHLGGYVRAVFVESGPTQSIRDVLRATTNIIRLDISPNPPEPLANVPWTDEFAAVFGPSLAQQGLQHVTLWSFEFRNAKQLENLLLPNPALKTLVLRLLRFTETEADVDNDEDGEPLVNLQRLDLYFFDASTIDALLAGFKRIDLTKLRSLYLHNTPMSSLVEANSATLEVLRIRAYYPDISLNENVAENALAEASKLLVLDLYLPFLPSLKRMLHRLGTLSGLSHLHTVIISVSQKTGVAEWTELDQLLGVVGGDLPALKQVRIYSGSKYDQPHPKEVMHEAMPVLSSRGVLRLLGPNNEALGLDR